MKKGAGVAPGAFLVSARSYRLALAGRGCGGSAVSSAKMSRSLVSGTKNTPMTTVASAMTIGYQSPE